MLNVIFPLMCVPPEDEEEEEDMMESDELSANTPQTMSAQVIDNLALHLPPESLIPNLVGENLKSQKLGSVSPFSFRFLNLACGRH